MKRLNQYLLPLIIVGSVLGAVMGIYFPKAALKTEILGTLFLNALFLLVVPLIVASMTAGVASLGNVRKLGKSGLLTIAYYIVTTCMSVLVGLILVNIIQPGRGIERSMDNFPDARYEITSRPLSGGSFLHLTSDETFRTTSYGKGYVIELIDRNIYGVIDRDARMTDKSVVVTHWVGQGGKTVEPKNAGVGVRIVRKTKPFRIRDLLLTMIPKNIIRAMVDVQDRWRLL